VRADPADEHGGKKGEKGERRRSTGKGGGRKRGDSTLPPGLCFGVPDHWRRKKEGEEKRRDNPKGGGKGGEMIRDPIGSLSAVVTRRLGGEKEKRKKGKGNLKKGRGEGKEGKGI